MMDELPPLPEGVPGDSYLDWWMAYHALEPWGDEWEQTGTIAAAAHNAPLLAKTERPELQPPSHFIPQLKGKKTKRAVSVEDDQAVMARLYGPKG